MVSNLVRSDWKSSFDRNRIINQFLFRLYLPRVEVIIFVAAQNDAGFEDVRTSCWHWTRANLWCDKKGSFLILPLLAASIISSIKIYSFRWNLSTHFAFTFMNMDSIDVSWNLFHSRWIISISIQLNWMIICILSLSWMPKGIDKLILMLWMGLDDCGGFTHNEIVVGEEDDEYESIKDQTNVHISISAARLVSYLNWAS